MKKISLKTIYLVALTAVFLVSFFAFAAFDLVSQQKQAEESLLEEARTFAKEMDAVWQFMDNSQKVINTSADGDYDFKGLHCSIVGKSVGAIFSAGNDYTIRYTNFNPRSIQDKPDAFEAAALESFDADAATREYYGVAEFDGEERFRYLQALEVDESCLECHGEPVGEIDITGHAKEGWTLDSVGGAISIVIPMDQQNQAMMGNVMRDVAFFLMLTVLIGAVIYLVTTFFVFRPHRPHEGGVRRDGGRAVGRPSGRSSRIQGSGQPDRAVQRHGSRVARHVRASGGPSGQPHAAICRRRTPPWSVSATTWRI